MMPSDTNLSLAAKPPFAERIPALSPVVLAWLAITAYSVMVLRAERQIAVFALLVAGGAVVFATKKLGWLTVLSRSFDRFESLATALAVVGVLVIASFFHDSSFVIFLLVNILVMMTACLGLNLQFGYAGMLNFAGAAMFGIGAYTAAFLGNVEWLPSLLLLPLGGALAALIGSILLPPMLRTRGHYSAVITIAFTLLFTAFLDSFPALGGSQGFAVRSMSLFGWSFDNAINLGGFSLPFYTNYLLVALLMAVLVGVSVRRIERSWIGLSLDAVRTDEISAATFGISTTATKVLAFSAGNFR
jgi:ABC-type branched-subunit amino acid transport system permease subunit